MELIIDPSPERPGSRPASPRRTSPSAEQADRSSAANHHLTGDERDDLAERRIAVGLLEGDRDALAEAFSRWGGMIHALCTQKAGRDAADDLTQQVFVEAWRTRSSFDPQRGVVPGWLVGIARNVTNRSFRGVREIPSDSATTDHHDPEPARDDAVADRLLVAQALSDLPEAQRTTLQLTFWEGLTQSQVAAHLGLPLGTVKSHQRRGMQRLRQILEVSYGH